MEPQYSPLMVNSAVSPMAPTERTENVSAAEVDAQDVHQTIIIGIAIIVAHQGQADSMEEEIMRFVEMNTDAEILEIETEVR